MAQNSYTEKRNELLDLAGLEREMPSDKVRRYIGYANAGDADWLKWIQRIERYGITNSLISDINRILLDVQVNAYPMLKPGIGRMGFRYSFSKAGSQPSYEAMIAFQIACLIGDGTLDKLKRCQFSECHKYFLGNAKAKYCSDRCGSNVRIRQSRGQAT